jgi:hypothetical protein
MPALPFGLYTTIGCIPWTAALGIAGYALGANWQQVANDFHGATYVIVGLIAVALVAAVILHFRHRRRASEGADPASSASAGPGRQAPSQQAPGRKAPGRKAPGQQAPGRKAPSRKAPGQQASGPQAPDWQSADWQAPGRQPVDQQARGPQARGPQPPIALAPGVEPSARQWAPHADRPYR